LGKTRPSAPGFARLHRTSCYAAIAWGLVPNTELATLLGCDSTAGTGGVDVSTVEGEIAGLIAAGREDLARELYPRREEPLRFAKAIDEAFVLRPELRSLPKPETIVCRCEDVTLERLQPCASFRTAKLHTRCGMGPYQGRVCGRARVSFSDGRTIPSAPRASCQNRNAYRRWHQR
jgi:hypothetical protein